jgi:hypothetical protein
VAHGRLAAAVLLPFINADTRRAPTTLAKLAGKFYTWKSTGRITPCGVDESVKPPRPLYNLGDLINLLWPPADT